MKARRFEPGDHSRWEEFLASAQGATLHHTRRFLDYHGDRFEDFSLLCESDAGELVAVLPAARDTEDNTTVVCHPGATVGGIALSPNLGAEDMMRIVQALLSAFREEGFGRLNYKTRPSHLSDQPFEIDQYVLWRLGASTYRTDLWNVIDLTTDHPIGRRRRRALRQAFEAELSVTAEEHETSYGAFHTMLAENLADRHEVKPTHSIDELLDLRERLGEDQQLWIVRDSENTMVAGEWVQRFRADVWHTQYIASTSAGRKSNAIDLLNHTIIEAASTSGARSLSFGASTEQAGSVLNTNLFDFKAGFGGGSVAHQFLSINLKTLPDGFSS